MSDSNVQFIKKYFLSTHALVVLFVFALLSGLLYMKGGLKINSTPTDSIAQVRYDPKLMDSFRSQQQVLGASTAVDEEVVSQDVVIGDDGQLESIDVIGQVLGASSDPLPVDFFGKTVEANTISFNQYLADLKTIEDEHIDTTTLEQALSGTNLEDIAHTAKRFEQVVKGMAGMTVPTTVLGYHKLKMEQYNAAAFLVQSFNAIDSNSELVSNALLRFMQTEEKQNELLTNLQKQYHE